MKHNSFLRVAAALVMVITFSLTTASPALALDLNPADYFQFNFNPVTFDKTEVAAGEVFHITITGSAVCSKDLPLPISQASVTSQVVAQPAAGGAALTLNPQFIIDINPMPRTAGQTHNVNQSVTLQFPAGAAPGSYTVVEQFTKAQVKVLIWIDITGSFPREQPLGTVKCIIPPPTPAPTKTTVVTSPPPTTASPIVATTASPSKTAPTPAAAPSPTTPTPKEAPVSGVSTLLTIAVIVFIIAVAVLIIVLVVVLRRRRL